ncbi:MAG: PHP domain-containing protein [Gemmatimonadota bacterium]
MSRVDLHLHSTASDGRLEPAEVVRTAAARGLAGLSLTDHDTTEGVEEAAGEAARLGMRFVAGAEISANEPGVSIHLLAYGFAADDPEISGFFRRFRETRERRIVAIVEKLHALGVELEPADVNREVGNGVPTRSHVARALVAGGHAGGIHEAFGRYIGRDRPAFVEKPPTRPGEVIRLVHAAGGVVLLAHPGSEFGEATIERWVDEGLDGVEIRHPRNRASARRELERLTSRRGLLRTGGSDWHGPGTGRADIGSEDVPLEWLDAIEARTRDVSRAHRRPTEERTS